GFALLESEFALFRLSYVDHGAVQPDGFVFSGVNGLGASFDPSKLTVGAGNAKLNLIGALFPDRGIDLFPHPLTVVLMHVGEELRRRPAERTGFEPEDLFTFRTPPHDVRGQITFEDPELTGTHGHCLDNVVLDQSRIDGLFLRKIDNESKKPEHPV